MNSDFKICPLCEVNKATQKSSHIFPRFMGVTLLTTEDNKRKGFSIGSNSKKKYDQDTPKEDYILCPGCESKNGQFEGKLANGLIHKLKEPKYASKFSHYKHNGYNKTFIPTIANLDIKLSILSMLFRAHITSLEPFRNCQLSPKQFILLRNILMRNRYSDIPILILTSSDQKYGENYYYAHTTSQFKLHILWVNDYLFIIVCDESHPLIKELSTLLLKQEEPPFIGVVPSATWDEMRRGLMGAMKRMNKN